MRPLPRPARAASRSEDLTELESPTRSVGATRVVPARPPAVPGLWPRGRPRGPPPRQARPGGSDFELDRLVALCPPCHVRTDASDARGRLIIRRHDTVPVRAPPDQARRPDCTDRSWRRPWGLLPGQAGSAPRSETLAYTEPFEQQGLDPPDVARRVTQGQPPSAGRTRTRVRRTVRPSSSARLGLAMTNRAPWRAVTTTKSAW